MHSFDTLLSDCKNNQQYAMITMYKMCYAPVYSACTRIVSNEQDAEEIVQDAFIKAFESINKFSGNQNNFIALVKTIVINKSIDWYRKQIRQPLFTDLDNPTIHFLADENDLDDEELPTCSFEIVKSNIDKLPNGYRLVLCMRLIDDFSFADIAKILKIKESSVRIQYVRAKNKLKQMLSQL